MFMDKIMITLREKIYLLLLHPLTYMVLSLFIFIVANAMMNTVHAYPPNPSVVVGPPSTEAYGWELPPVINYINVLAPPAPPYNSPALLSLLPMSEPVLIDSNVVNYLSNPGNIIGYFTAEPIYNIGAEVEGNSIYITVNGYWTGEFDLTTKLLLGDFNDREMYFRDYHWNQ